MSPRSLAKKNLFLFDLDGVFYKGKESREVIGGREIIGRLRALGKQIFVLTNNSTDTAETVGRRLREFSIGIETKEILTSGLLTADYLRTKHGKVSYFLVGEPGLEKELSNFGHLRKQEGPVDFVVVGLDRVVTYQKLDTAARLVREGAGLVATHASKLYMYKTGPAMATGPLVKAIEYASGRRALVIGKPSPRMFRMALQKAGCEKAEAVMVGDQVDTDILGAFRAGVDAVLVTSGVDKSAGDYPVVATVSNVDALARFV